MKDDWSERFGQLVGKAIVVFILAIICTTVFVLWMNWLVDMIQSR